MTPPFLRAALAHRPEGGFRPHPRGDALVERATQLLGPYLTLSFRRWTRRDTRRRVDRRLYIWTPLIISRRKEHR